MYKVMIQASGGKVKCIGVMPLDAASDAVRFWRAHGHDSWMENPPCPGCSE